jgi:hypothetical protein
MNARTLRILLTVDALIGLAAGTALLLLPDGFLSFAQVSLAPTGVVVARLYGAELLGFGIATWLVRNTSTRRSSIVLGHIVNESLTAVVIAIAVVSGIGGPGLAALAAIACLLAIGFWLATLLPRATDG